MPDEDRKQYNRFLDNLHTEASIADTVRIEQEEKVAEEKAKKVIEIAMKCIKRGDSNEEIMEISDLTLETIERLREGDSSE